MLPLILLSRKYLFDSFPHLSSTREETVASFISYAPEDSIQHFFKSRLTFKKWKSDDKENDAELGGGP